jgi:hypothetical protein
VRENFERYFTPQLAERIASTTSLVEPGGTRIGALLRGILADTANTDMDARTEANARQREASDPAASCFVTASAGSGKTKLLTDRLLRLMLGGAAPERLLCLTFTKAAAAENKISRKREAKILTAFPELSTRSGKY